MQECIGSSLYCVSSLSNLICTLFQPRLEMSMQAEQGGCNALLLQIAFSYSFLLFLQAKDGYKNASSKKLAELLCVLQHLL
jgi:hypothetical protein